MTAFTGIAIYPDKRVEEVILDHASSLEGKQEIVKGWIEPVDLHTPSGEYVGTMWVNEEGRYVFGPDDFNSIASDVAGLMGRSDLMLTGILGPVLVVGPADPSNGNRDTDVTYWQRNIINRVTREAGR